MSEDDREAADELGLLIRDIYREHGMYTPDQTVADLIIEAGYRKVIQPSEQEFLSHYAADVTVPQPSDGEYRHEDACRCGVVGDATLPCHEPSERESDRL